MWVARQPMPSNGLWADHCTLNLLFLTLLWKRCLYSYKWHAIIGFDHGLPCSNKLGLRPRSSSGCVPRGRCLTSHCKPWWNPIALSPVMELGRLCIFGAKPSPELMLSYCTLINTLQWNLDQTTNIFFRKCISKHRMQNVGHFVVVSICFWGIRSKMAT